jgi:hypothetical protein
MLKITKSGADTPMNLLQSRLNTMAERNTRPARHT